MTPVADDGESRAHLQERLRLYTRYMFLAFIVLRVFERLLYTAYPEVAPAHYPLIVLIGLAGLGVFAITMAAVHPRRTVGLRRLHAIDLALTASTSLVFGVTAAVAHDRHESAYTCLIYACFTVFVRTIAIPSTARRTAVVATVAFLPVWIAGGYLATTTEQDIPGPGFFGGGVMYGLVAISISIAGSRVIYGLRRRASQDRALGQYRLEGKLGQGATGDVFIARHALLRRPTAIKLVHPERVGAAGFARCQRAVQQMSQLVHHNTAAVFDYGRSADGALYFAMEFLDGLDLDTLVTGYGPQPEQRVRHILLQLCGALHEAHGLGFAHGNITARNVILCERGAQPDVAKLTDYGFALTAAEPTPADDVHALGLLARYLLTGTDADIAASGLAAVVLACLDADPANRPPSAKALAAQLRALSIADWTHDRARTWWMERRRHSAQRLAVPSTIAVDLAERAQPEASD